MSCDPTSLVAGAACLECGVPPGMQLPVLISLFCQLRDNPPSAPVVARVALEGQTASIPATTLAISPSDGMYRITFSLACSTPGAAGTATLTRTSTDFTGTVNLTEATINLNTTTTDSGVDEFLSLKGTPVNYSVAVAGASGNPQYVVFIILERMS